MERCTSSTISTARTVASKPCSASDRSGPVPRSPEADAPGIDVHEVAARVIAPPPTAEGACVGGKPERRVAAEAYINGPALEMHAVDRHPFRAPMQHRIGRRRAITADHREGPVAVGARLQLEQHVEECGIDCVHITGAEIAQQLIDLGEAI